MSNEHDSYLDDLGIAWHAIDPALDIRTPQLKAHLQRQSLLIGCAIAGCTAFGVAGAGLGVFSIWQGFALGAWNFLTRGIAIEAVAVFLLLAVRLLWPVRASDHARALADLVDLGLARSMRGLKVVRLGLGACAVTAVLGLAGSGIRYAAGNPPALSPAVDLAVLAAGAFAFLLFGFRMRTELAKFAYLRRALSDG